MRVEYPSPFKRAVGRFLVTVGRLLSVADPMITMPAYFRLRDDILRGMPWTVQNLHPLITPYLPGERLPVNGYTSAMIQVNGFNVIIYRQSQQGLNDDSFSISSPCFPEQLFAFGVTEAAVLEKEGAEGLKVIRYSTMSDVDLSLQSLSSLLERHLSCELFPDTKVVIERILSEGMMQATRPTHSQAF